MGEKVRATVLVTGGAGFIGSHLVDKLVHRGTRVIVIDDLSTGRIQNIARHLNTKQVQLIEADVCEGLLNPLYNVLHGTNSLDAIVHLAAQTSVTRSMQAPLEDARINYIGLLRTLELARIISTKRFIYASSAAVYGDPVSVPLKETDSARPQSPYGVHKLAGEHLLNVYAATLGISCFALRLFNVYGPRQALCNSYSGVVSMFAHQALRGDRYLTIHGDGHQSRDFIFVGDVASTIASVCESEEVPGGVYNVGTGKETTVLKLAQKILQIVGCSAELRHVCRCKGDLYRSVADRSASELLGLRKPTPLEVGLTQTLEHIRSAPRAGVGVEASER
jgi:UDP-glucose 4-epimerase